MPPDFARPFDRDRRESLKNQHIVPPRLPEKTPNDALRQPLLEKAFPRARDVVFSRNPRRNIIRMMEVWRSGRGVTYRRLPGQVPIPGARLSARMCADCRVKGRV